MTVAMKGTVALMYGLARLAKKQSDEARLAALHTRDDPRPSAVTKRLLRDHTVAELTVAGRPVVRLTPRGPVSGQQLLYTHGGGYVSPLGRPHWWVLERMTRGTGAVVTVPLYRLAPQGRADEAYPFLREVYDQVSAAGPVTLAGDSAGGGLALGQALAYRDAALAPPRQVLLFAPWLDLTMSHPDVPGLAPRDPMLRADRLVACGRLWAGDQPMTDPLLSPGFADLHDLPPVHVFQGGRDLFAADARQLHRRLVEAGNTGTFTFEPDGFHVYVGARWTKEARSSLQRAGELLAARSAA